MWGGEGEGADQGGDRCSTAASKAARHIPEPQAQIAGVVLNETVKEMQDQQSREANLLIFRAPEPQSILKETREKGDVELVNQLCNNICQAEIDPKPKIVKTVRLGQKTG